MVDAISVAAVAKKVLEVLASNEKGRRFIGYVLGISVFILTLPMIVICGLFGWMSDDGATLILRQELIDNLSEDDAAVLEQMGVACDTIRAVFEIRGMSSADERKADVIYLSYLVEREGEENFYNKLADCFAYVDDTRSVYDWVETLFGVEIPMHDREKIEEIGESS